MFLIKLTSLYIVVSGLEIMMACFDKALAPEWHRVAKCIIDTGMKGNKLGVDPCRMYA